MRQVQGADVYIRVKIPGSGLDYLPYACSTTLNFSCDQEIIEKTTYESGAWKQYTTGFSEWGITLGSVTSILPLEGQFAVFDLLVETVRRNAVQVELSFSDTDGNLKVITGYAIIPHIGISAEATGFAQDDIEIKGTGEFTISTVLNSVTINANEVYKYEYIATGGETSVVNVDFFGREMLGVFRGFPHEIITVGTPTEIQALHDGGTSVQFAATVPMNIGEYVLIQYK